MTLLGSRGFAEFRTFSTRDTTHRFLTLQNLPFLLIGIIFLIVLKFASTLCYNVYFHPLAKYPGPKYAAMSGLVYWIVASRGELLRWTHKQHEEYGEVVRLGPDRLSYINPRAWKDIYGHRTSGEKENSKDKRFYLKAFNGEDHIITIQDAVEHGRLRKVFSNAFSDKALKIQELLIKTHVDRLINNIYRIVAKNPDADIDMVKLYNCTTFDIMGELTFGEPLGLLENSEYTPWVKAIFGSVKTVALLRVGLEYPWIGAIMRWLIPSSLREKEKLHFQHSADRVDRRLTKGVNKEKPDIWNLVLEKAQDQLSLGQMHANAEIFMIAGTETTATLLSGLTYYFLKNPDRLRKATAEVRACSEDELSLVKLPHLTYLAACFEEALRIYPPVPLGLPREVAEGGKLICGAWVPSKTRVTVSHWAAYHSKRNFKDPDSFIPERWLPGYGYDSDRNDVWQPFSFGPRNCLGKNLAYHEMRLIMAKVLWHFDLELCAQSEAWVNQRTWALWQKPPLWCRVRPIRKTAATE